MESSQDKNKRIAKNTLMLYLRMFLVMFVGLYTGRVVLQTLGVENFGIYNVVGGLVSMFSIFTASLSNAISRFLTYELGHGDKDRLSLIFSTSLSVMLFIGILIIILTESIAPWFLETHLNIPAGRYFAAHCALQLSILTFVLGLFMVPFNASIIAHERMTIFAHFSIIEVILNLIFVSLLYIIKTDKLIFYAILMAFLQILMNIIYTIYCCRNFSECSFHLVYEKKLLKEMTSFAGWNLLGSGAYLFNTQGVNIATNMFFGVTFNAARGVADKVNGLLNKFVANFTVSFNPQITKSYASGNIEYMCSLILKGAKYSYFLMFLISLPFFFEAEEALYLWLGNVPEHASLFLKLTIVCSLADILGNSTANGVWATGKIRKYYMYVGTIGAMVFPISFILFKCGFPAESSYFIFIAIYIILIFVKVQILQQLTGISSMAFYKEVIGKIVPVTLLSILPPIIICRILPESLIRMIIVFTVTIPFTLFIIYMSGISKNERKLINQYIKKLLHKVKI